MSHTSESINVAVIQYIQENFLYDRPDVMLAPDLRLFEAGIIDSLGLVRLLGFLNETFQVRVEPDEVLLENFETLTAINGFVRGKLEAAGASQE